LETLGVCNFPHVEQHPPRLGLEAEFDPQGPKLYNHLLVENMLYIVSEQIKHEHSTHGFVDVEDRSK
jgi:hypothetical protein